MSIGIGVDVYGTLVDPLAMSDHLRTITGDAAERLAEQWRAKQLEYTFRRTAMGLYANFDVCTRQALQFVLASARLSLSALEQDRLVALYEQLDAYPDAIAGLRKLRDRGYTLMAFSNGVEATVRRLLKHGGLLPHLDGIITVDQIATFKPDPRVYAYLAERLQRNQSDTWLVSSNAFDVIGAKAAGLKAAWIRRNPTSVFDTWGIEPDLIAADVIELAEQMQIRT
jgi:2-haloacid dehalogenase